MRGNRMKTRAVSFLLALAMILTMVPAQNLQAAEPAGEQPAISTQNEEPTEGKEASFGWDLTLTSLPEGGAWTWQADDNKIVVNEKLGLTFQETETAAGKVRLKIF